MGDLLRGSPSIFCVGHAWPPLRRIPPGGHAWSFRQPGNGMNFPYMRCQAVTGEPVLRTSKKGRTRKRAAL
eukprot:5244100-Alexandrium_andersonii.AAC.1